MKLALGKINKQIYFLQIQLNGNYLIIKINNNNINKT